MSTPGHCTDTSTLSLREGSLKRQKNLLSDHDACLPFSVFLDIFVRDYQSQDHIEVLFDIYIYSTNTPWSVFVKINIYIQEVYKKIS